MGKRVCNHIGCPVLIDGPGRCPQHQREAEVKRGSRQQRGYDARHDAERRRWAAILERTPVPCAKCHAPVTSQHDWHLGHTDDRSTWTGPEHALCNLSAAGRASHRIAPHA